MLSFLAAAAIAAADPVVSTAWLQAHLNDPNVRIIYVGEQSGYDRGHIPGARMINHQATVDNGHRLADARTVARAFEAAGAADGTHIILYGDTPMATGWIYMTLVSIGHGDDVSLLDGGPELWQAEKRPVSKIAPGKAAGSLTVKPVAPDLLVDAAWVRAHLSSPATKILDVRTTQEYGSGHVPGSTLILWQDLYSDLQTQKLKSRDEIRTLLMKSGVGTDQDVVTYCAIGMRASLMFWAARFAGVPAHVYVGSWHDWQGNPSNPIAR